MTSKGIAKLWIILLFIKSLISFLIMWQQIHS